jgi:Flp pilus assembly protein TadG
MSISDYGLIPSTQISNPAWRWKAMKLQRSDDRRNANARGVLSAGRPTRESGQTTVLMAFVMATFMFGFIALGIDVESLFHAKRMAQAAADAAALAAAEQYLNSHSSAQTAANAMAKLNGYDTTLATNPATVTLNVPPKTGNYVAASGATPPITYVEAVVSQPIQTFFMSVLNHKSTMTVSARAVGAVLQNSPTCVCLEKKTGMALNMSNNSKLSTAGCGTTVDSSDSNAVGIVGSASLSGISLGIFSSTWTAAANVNNNGSIAAGTKVVNPISTRCGPPLPPAPTLNWLASNWSKCTADPLGHYNNGGSTYSVGPLSDTTLSNTQGGNLVCYNSLTVGSNNDNVTLNPGIYVINGGILSFLSGKTTGGNGVFFYLTGGAHLTIDNNANVNLTAPSSGAYNGILIFQDPLDTQPMTVGGGANLSFNGGIYAPSSDVTVGNGGWGVVIDADLIANTLTMTGGATLNSTPSAGMGTMSTTVSKVVE